MVGEGGRVLGIERHPPLAQRSIASVRRAAPELLERGTVSLMAGNALDEALLDQHGPFDAIHVGAAADDLPQVGYFPCPFRTQNGSRTHVAVASCEACRSFLIQGSHTCWENKGMVTEGLHVSGGALLLLLAGALN